MLQARSGQTNHQMESLLMHGWSQTNPQGYLLVHLHPCGFLDNSMLCFHSSFTTWMAYMICGFHNGIHTSQSQDRHLSSVTQRDNNPWSQFKQISMKLQQNLYGLKDGQVTWHEHIKSGLKE